MNYKNVCLVIALSACFNVLHPETAQKAEQSSYIVRKAEQLKHFIYENREEIIVSTVGAVALYAYGSYVFGSSVNSESTIDTDMYHDHGHSDCSHCTGHHHHHDSGTVISPNSFHFK